MTLRVVFWRSDKPRERILSEAFCQGVRKHGDVAEELPLAWEIPDPLPACDIACMVGVKSKRRFQAHWGAGIHTLYIDKGYTRTDVLGPVKCWEYWRFSLDGHHPTRYLMDIDHDGDRWARLNLEIKPWRQKGHKIIFAGSSGKYHEFYGMEEPTYYAMKQIKRLGKMFDQNEFKIIYRPKPSWTDAVPVSGSTWDREPTIWPALKHAWCLVTHGSNAVWEAVLSGIPTVVLGDAVSRPISSTDIDAAVEPLLVSDEQRQQWCERLAWCQWTTREMASGEAWAHIKSEFFKQCV